MCVREYCACTHAPTLTRILGAVAQIDSNVQKHQSMQSAQVDARTHAGHIMTLASITNLLSSIALCPVYQLYLCVTHTHTHTHTKAHTHCISVYIYQYVYTRHMYTSCTYPIYSAFLLRVYKISG